MHINPKLFYISHIFEKYDNLIISYENLIILDELSLRSLQIKFSKIYIVETDIQSNLSTDT